MPSFRWALALIAGAGIGVCAGWAAAEPPPAIAVTIDNFAFTPQDLTIAAGTTVTWTNRDDIPHTVAADDKSWKSNPLDTDDKFSRTFATPGTYAYFCSIHPKMTAHITVK